MFSLGFRIGLLLPLYLYMISYVHFSDFHHKVVDLFPNEAWDLDRLYAPLPILLKTSFLSLIFLMTNISYLFTGLFPIPHLVLVDMEVEMQQNFWNLGLVP